MMWQEHVDPVLLENEMVWNTMKVSQQSFFQKVLTQVIYMLFILSPANNSYTFVTGCYWLKIDEDHVQLLLTGGSAPFVRRRCDCLASSAPFTNTQTYLLTYLLTTRVQFMYITNLMTTNSQNSFGNSCQPVFFCFRTYKQTTFTTQWTHLTTAATQWQYRLCNTGWYI